jgi:GNAT superfamily N-acetyltransferase
MKPASPDDALVASADRNYVGSYRKLADHCPSGGVRSFGAVTAFTTGLPLGLFNGCVAVGPADPADLSASIRWIADLHIPHRVWIREDLTPALEAIPLDIGMVREAWSAPAMVLQPDAVRPSPAPGVSVRVVDDQAALDEYLELHVRKGMTSELAHQMFPASFAADPDVRFITAYLEGRAAGSALAVRTGDTSGVYNVGTLAEVRRRGVGTAVTWAAVEAGRAWGCDTIVLQSSEMGLPMYREMGFRTVTRYDEFRVARPAP